MNTYSNDRGVRWFTIIISPIFMYLFGFICMIQGKFKDTYFFRLVYHAFTQVLVYYK
jgi:hypothetical protein